MPTRSKLLSSAFRFQEVEQNTKAITKWLAIDLEKLCNPMFLVRVSLRVIVP